MKFSTRTRYGIRTMLEIGLHYGKGGIPQKEIASNQEISYRTLDHILHALMTAELIAVSDPDQKVITYTLTRPPEEITILDIQKAIEPLICVVDCVSVHFSCDRREFCTARGFWCRLNDRIIDFFKSVTLDEMIADQRNLNRKKHPGKVTS